MATIDTKEIERIGGLSKNPDIRAAMNCLQLNGLILPSQEVDVSKAAELVLKVRESLDEIDGTAFGRLGELLDRMATDCDLALAALKQQ